ncbi:MAG TPA: glycine C-acetyltransferase [Vicinamibacterales bacterium]|nr:glycine C-acetyltransferase [Vicinamibacterales bacterium]
MRTDPLSYLGTELDTLREQGLYRSLRILDGRQEATSSFDGRHVVNLSSNNYLGLTTHPDLERRAHEAIETFGVGSGSVRTIAGTMAIHMELERRLAAFKKTEAVVVFQSGFAANAGTVQAILTKDDVIISDELNHASIIDGCRLSKAAIKVFPHKDAGAARKILQDLPSSQRKLLITDGVFSMDGDLGALPELCQLAEEFGCIMMVDDAHASGVFGKQGRGTIDHFGMHGRVDIQVGTLSKAIGALGGYVAGSKTLIEYLYHRARPFLFSTSHPPSVTATCLAALDILENDPGIIERLWDNTRFFKSGLQELGFNTGLSQSPITPVIAGEGSLAMKLSDRLFAEGVFAQGIAYPTVARDKARVRTIVTASHTREQLQFALDTFKKVGTELGLI